MEGEKHRARRETRERAAQTAEGNTRAGAEAAARAGAEAQARAARGRALRAQAETAALSAESERREKAEEAKIITEELKSTGGHLNPLRTIKTDMAKAVREEGLSLSKIANLSAEKSRRQSLPGEREPTKWWVALSALLVLAGGGGLLFRWWQESHPLPPPAAGSTAAPPSLTLFTADRELALDVTGLAAGNEAREVLNTVAEQGEKENGLTNIYFYQGSQTLGFSRLRQLLDLSVPDNLTRYLRDSFMFGFYDNGELRSRFLLLQTSFFDQTWAAMLEWERYLPTDLAPLLETEAQKQVVWSDRIIRNKDVRVASDSAGSALLVYGFLDERDILVARDENTFIKVFERLIEQS